MHRIEWYNHPRSGIPDAALRRLVRLATPRDIGRTQIYIGSELRSQPFRAESWTEGSVTPFVEIQLNGGLAWPYYQEHDAAQLRRGYLPWGWLHGPDELLLACLAHELRHVWQGRRELLRCDTDADRWALSRLERYRRAA
jgi:hypothetical protein